MSEILTVMTFGRQLQLCLKPGNYQIYIDFCNSCQIVGNKTEQKQVTAIVTLTADDILICV